MKILRRFFICVVLAGLLLPASFAQTDTNAAKAATAEADICFARRRTTDCPGPPDTARGLFRKNLADAVGGLFPIAWIRPRRGIFG